MTKTTLQKVTLSTMSLLAGLALAQAGTGHPSSSTGHGSNAPFKIWDPTAPDAQYVLDDGSSEDAVAFGDGIENFESLWFNHFTVIPGAETIASVDIVWGTPNNSTPANQMNGKPVTVCVWSDPNNDGDPTDATLLGSVAGTVQNANTDTFVTYTLSTPVTIPGTSFFVGDKTPANSSSELFFQGFDESSTHRQSWVAAMSSGAPVVLSPIGANDFLGIIDDFGLSGNWMIRANSTGGGGGGLTLNSAVSRKTHGGAGKFDIPLPGIEDRKGPLTVVFNFSESVSSVDSISSSCGSVTTTSTSGSSFSVSIDNRDCSNQTVTITLTGVHATNGDSLDSAETSVGLLVGDVNGDGTVDSADLASIRANTRQPVTQSNFRNDVQPNGQINAIDARTARGNEGASL